jgi:predicted nucleic acid-binding protein
VDANVFMYTAGRPHPLREPCRQALEAALNTRVRLVTDSEVLQEILYRYFSIQKPLAAKTVYRATVDMCDEILPIAESHTARALELLLQYPSLSPRDALHIATMEGRGLRNILSTDCDFDEVKEIRRIDPADFGPL